MTVAIYPGSFDPVTLGHLDLIERGAKNFEKLVVCVARNVSKSALFDVDERIALIKECVKDMPSVEVVAFDGLLIDAAQKLNAAVVLRGLRAVSDFDYEFQMAHMNHKLAPEVETVFMMTGEDFFYVSSGLVKEVCTLGGDIRPFVPAHVADALLDKIRTAKGANP